MSKTLLIRHLSSDLEVSEREDFLKYFGAERVWFINSKSHTAFASFPSQSAAENALLRLHQLEILGRRLTVEYARSESNSHNETFHTENSTSKCANDFLNLANSWNPSINLLQPPPVNLCYNYPNATAEILFNMLFALGKNVQFYVQTLHLMNKMSLDPPFKIMSSEVQDYVKDCLNSVQIKYFEKSIPSETIATPMVPEAVSSEESEMSTNSEENIALPEVNINKPVKRKCKLKKITSKPSAVISNNVANNKVKRKNISYDPAEVFESSIIHETKKIEVNVNKILSVDTVVSEDVGIIGKMTTTDKPEVNEISQQLQDTRQELSLITKKDLLMNRISLKDMKVLPVFKNYHPGPPSMRLYIKNLSKDTISEDIERIYKSYIADCDFKEAELFSVRVLQEGRMKGQAFVTFPSVELSQKALNETNGFILKNKPMVVQFARSAK